ncbi:zincin [Melanomma pulvis-pyrius CBS 109.77]|uniref:Zincin n=1 Tax=Melanomma pulvis-pyrius CBS 109.77 TaxID=1314802 RepID=A0A6A6X1Q1_9PLEO|nr:zincin [Melanomma pulvis-pyrius CBS 109.77]
MVSLDDECPRWTPGSVIRWAAWRQGFKDDEDANFAATHLQIAAERWNSLNIGVTFEWVALAKDATFVLCHGGSNGSTLAQAFYPNPNDLSYLLVYNAAFSLRGWKENMWKVFTHELGHVLGLRHEFAMDTNPKTGEVFEVQKAVQLGPRNESSVMVYKRTPPEIQQSDIDSTKAFYALADDAAGNPPRVGKTDVRDYNPM